MSADDDPQAIIDLQTVEAELHTLLASIDWTRVRLDALKAELAKWVGASPLQAIQDAPSDPQHDSTDDALDEAIIAEHDRLDESTQDHGARDPDDSRESTQPLA